MQECRNAGLNMCKMRERRMQEYIAGVCVICGRKMGTGNNVWGQGQSGQSIKLFQARQKIMFYLPFLTYFFHPTRCEMLK